MSQNPGFVQPISLRAMSRLVGVSKDGNIGRVMKTPQSKLNTYLRQKGFLQQDIESVASTGVPFSLQLVVLEYYAFHAGRYCKEIAYENLCKLKGEVYVPRLINQSGRDKCHLAKTGTLQYKLSEKGRQKALHRVVGGDMEVPTLVGRIDILTPTELIEVKTVRDWKAALGQLIAYSFFYPDHILRMHLFGRAEPEFLALIQKVTEPHQILITWEP